MSDTKTKKQVLKQILTKLENVWDIASPILVLLEWNKLEKPIIDYLVFFLHKVVKKLQTSDDISNTIKDMYDKEIESTDMLYHLKQQILQKK